MSLLSCHPNTLIMKITACIVTYCLTSDSRLAVMARLIARDDESTEEAAYNLEESFRDFSENNEKAAAFAGGLLSLIPDLVDWTRLADALRAEAVRSGRPDEQPDWESAAKGAADYLHENSYEDRGALPWNPPGVSVVFGRDGYAQFQSSRDEVEVLRRRFHEMGIEELGWAVSDSGYTWAMLVRDDVIDRLEYHLEQSWYKVASQTV